MMIEIVNQPQNTTRYPESRRNFLSFFFYSNSVVYRGSRVIMSLLLCINLLFMQNSNTSRPDNIQVISQGLCIFINEYFQLKMTEYLISL